MIYVLGGLSILFAVLGLILTEKNVPILLAGYTILSEEDRARFDILSYVRLFRVFHLVLGGTFLAGGLILDRLAGSQWTGIFMGGFPLLAYIYLIWRSRSYYRGLQTSTYRAGMMILAGALVFVIFLFTLGIRENRLEVASDGISISGMYGLEIPGERIASVSMVESLPEIRAKRNGFALGDRYKGIFVTGDNRAVRLLLNRTVPPYLLIRLHSGEYIYFAGRNPSEEYYKGIIQEVYPPIERKP